MDTIQTRKRSWSVALALLILTSAPIVDAKPAHAAVACSCVQYVKNYFGLTGTVGNAKDMGPGLQARGFKKLSGPANGAVIIFQPSFSADVNQTYGHTAVIREFKSVQSAKNWEVTYRGASQAGGTSKQTNAGCNNVNYKTRVYSKSNKAVSYYKR